MTRLALAGPAGRALPRWLVEGVVAATAWWVTAVVLTWPQLRDPTVTAPGNLGDPLYFAFQLAWVGHGAVHDPAGLWTTNAFQGTPGNLAFTDTVLGYLPLSVLGWLAGGGQAGALLVLNVATVAATALAALGAYTLARALGASPAGAAVAGAAFGFAPWRLEQVIHLNVISTGGMALALAFLFRGHAWSLRSGWRPERMHAGWIAAGWAVACWQLTLGFATGIVFGYVLAGTGLALVCGWLVLGRPHLTRRLVLTDLIGAALFAAWGALLTLPYLAVADRYPEAARTEATLGLFSPPWQGLLTAPEASRMWGEAHAARRQTFFWVPEMVLLPGFVLIALALASLFVSAWPVRRRALLAGGAIVTAVLALGVHGPAGGRFTYLPIFRHLPGWEALRTPGRLVIWVTLLLALLAAGLVTRLVERAVDHLTTAGAGRRATAALLVGAAVVLPAAAVLAEGRGRVPHWVVSRQPVRLSHLPAPVLVLPTAQVADYHIMLWGTEGFPLLTNGDSGFNPAFQVRMRQEAATFPDHASVAALRARGVRTVVVVRSRTPGTPWAGAADVPVEGLGISRADLGDAVVYGLGP